jgi:hypothetical protein
LLGGLEYVFFFRATKTPGDPMSPVSDEFQAEDLKAGDAAYSDGEREQIYQAAMDFWVIMLYLYGCDHYFIIIYIITIHLWVYHLNIDIIYLDLDVLIYLDMIVSMGVIIDNQPYFKPEVQIYAYIIW